MSALENISYANKAIFNLGSLVMNTAFLPTQTLTTWGTIQQAAGGAFFQVGNQYPPQPNSLGSTNGGTVGGITYTFTASSDWNVAGNGTGYVGALFDYTLLDPNFLSTFGAANFYYTGGSGAYTGGPSSTTDAYTSTAYGGAWVQIQASTAFTLSSYWFAGRYNFEYRMPSAFAMFGSTNGTTWYLLQPFTSGQTFSSPQKFNKYYITVPGSYTYYRLVATNAPNNPMDWGQLFLFGNSTSNMNIIGGNVGIGITNPGASLQVLGNVYVSNAITTTNANILSIQTSNLIPATQGLFMNLQSNFTLTGNWYGNIAGTITSNLYTLFNSTGGQTWNAYGQSAGPIIRGPTANGGFTFAQTGPYSMTCSIASVSGVKTLAISSNAADIHSNVTNVWSYCFRYSFGEIPSIPVTLPFYVSSTSTYYYLDIETNVQGDTVYQTAYSNLAANAYTGSYVIIRPI